MVRLWIRIPRAQPRQDIAALGEELGIPRQCDRITGDVYEDAWGVGGDASQNSPPGTAARRIEDDSVWSRSCRPGDPRAHVLGAESDVRQRTECPLRDIHRIAVAFDGIHGAVFTDANPHSRSQRSGAAVEIPPGLPRLGVAEIQNRLDEGTGKFRMGLPEGVHRNLEGHFPIVDVHALLDCCDRRLAAPTTFPMSSAPTRSHERTNTLPPMCHENRRPWFTHGGSTDSPVTNVLATYDAWTRIHKVIAAESVHRRDSGAARITHDLESHARTPCPFSTEIHDAFASQFKNPLNRQSSLLAQGFTEHCEFQFTLQRSGSMLEITTATPAGAELRAPRLYAISVSSLDGDCFRARESRTHFGDHRLDAFTR